MAAESPNKSAIQQKAKETAIGLLCAKHLHQCLWLPSTNVRPRTRVAFATTSNFDNQDLPAILFCGPMFGSRYNALLVDHLAGKMGVRVICVDRPGMGGSMPVPLNQRLNTWLETVPFLLAKVGVKHVSLIAHSAGTVYLLNTLVHCRDILHPTSPLVAFFAPWVHNDHSHVTLTKIASKLPESWIANFSSISVFMNQRIMPLTSWSGGIISSMTALFKPTPPTDETDEETRAQETYGVDSQTAAVISKLNMKYLLAESVSGANDEVLFCLKKAEPGLWGACDDYHQYVRTFVDAEKARRRRGDADARRFNVRMYFAESDLLIGEGGREYFERMWKQYGVSDVAHVESKVMAQTDHDSVIIDFVKGGLKEAFEEVSHVP